MPSRHPRTVVGVPPDFEEIRFFSLTEHGQLVWLNIAAIVMLGFAGGFFVGWLLFYHTVLNGPLVIPGLPDSLNLDAQPWRPMLLALTMLIVIIPLHEWVHGLGMAYYGHPVRYGVKWSKGVVYATTDNGLFWRNQFVMVGLAPLVAISLLCIGLSLFLTPEMGLWLMVIAALNAAGAVGDLWMTWIAAGYPTDVLIRDEEDGMRIFSLKREMEQ